MNEKKTSEILILGIGNVLMGDEGVGAFVAQLLSDEPFPENVRCLDGGTAGFILLGEFQSADIVIMIDATVDGLTPGTWKRIEPRYSSDYPQTLTAHDIGLKDLLDAAQILGKMPKVILYAISIAPLDKVGWGLSPQLEAVVPEICEQIKKEVQRNVENASVIKTDN